MKKIYKSKVDMWLVVALLFFVICPIIPIMIVDFSWLAIVIVLIIFVFAIYPILSISYVISDSMLFVRCGILHEEKFQIKNIYKIQDTNSILSAPAASLKRIAIYFRGSSTPLIISPLEKEDFIENLMVINPDISYTA